MPATPSNSFTRPANTTQYNDGDLVANHATAASVTPLKFTTSKMIGQGTISRLRFHKSNNSATNANFIVHLFSSDPGVPTNGDNGAFGIASAAGHIGSVDCDLTTGGLPGTAGLSKAFAITNGMTFDLTAVPGERRLYGLIEANAAYTPADSEVFTIVLEIMN